MVYVALLHEGVAMFNSSYLVKEQSRNFYLPYEYDFAPGSYTARLSAANEPAGFFHRASFDDYFEVWSSGSVCPRCRRIMAF